ncbi:MAG: sigma-70 family RNA polymerase sigma factor [Candidatus Kapaibacteriales bacterium]
MEMLAQGGSNSQIAFTQIYDECSSRIKAYLWTVSKDQETTSDLFQETFTRFYKSCTQKRRDGEPMGWLIRIARNLWINTIRDRKQKVELDSIQLVAEIENGLEEKEDQRLLKIAIESLPEDMREAVALRFYSEMAYDEIAEILDITAARARYLVFTAKAKMKKTLQPYY